MLREYADPMQNMSAFLGINSIRLEKVEERLKSDIVKEAKSLGGLILVHQELCKSLFFYYYYLLNISKWTVRLSHAILQLIKFKLQKKVKRKWN